MDDCTFCQILSGEKPGVIIARDETRRLAIIENIHPEGAVHWLALPYEHFDSTEALQRHSQERFLELLSFAIDQTRRYTPDYPALRPGFSLKLHMGNYESMPHPKLHILSVE